MPSFDIVSEVDLQEVHNAVDQANRELSTRYDFRGVTAEFIRQGSEVQLTAQADIQLDQMMDILRGKLIKRGVDPKVMDVADPAAIDGYLNRFRQHFHWTGARGVGGRWL